MIDEDVLERMERYGGSFVRHLAALYRLADCNNKKKLERCFKGYFETYRNLGEQADVRWGYRSFENVDVEFEEERWRVFIRIYSDGVLVKEMVADASILSGDGIWFGEYEKWIKAADEQ